MMIKHVRAVLGAVAAALMVGLGTTPVVAATATWTVTPGGGFYTFESAQNTQLKDTTAAVQFRCNSFSVTGGFKSGTGLTNPIGTIRTASGGGIVGGQAVLLCGGNGLAFHVTFGGLPWGIHAVRYDPAGAGATNGRLVRVDATLAANAGAPTCSATIDGTAPGAADGTMGFRYLNDGEFFLQAGTLHFYNVSGCNGLISSGDSMTYAAYMVIYTKTGMQPNVITSP